MSKFEWNVTINNRNYQVRYVNGEKTSSEIKGLYVDNVKIAQPVEKMIGLNKLKYEFSIGSEELVLQVYGLSCDLILHDFYVKHKTPANRKAFDWATAMGFVCSVFFLFMPIIFGFQTQLILLTVAALFGNVVIALSPFYMGWKKILFNLICSVAFWGVSLLVII